MASRALHGEDYAGLAAALALHGVLLAVLLLQPASKQPPPPPERMTVTLAEDAAPQSTSPEPQAEAAAPAAPMLAPELEPEPMPSAAPTQLKPLPKAVTQLRPAPVAVPQPRPVARPQPRQPPTPPPRAAARQQAAPAQRPAARPAGASRISDDFLKGVPGASANGEARNPPAAVIGPAVRSALASAISRELKPHWAAPQGAEAELLVTILTFDLARDGSLTGAPRLVRQEGITDANRSQAARHAEQAMRAVRLAAPFDLPPQYYDAWKRVTAFRFDRRLSQ